MQTVVIIGRTTVYNNIGGIWGLNNGDNGIRMASANGWFDTGNGGNTNDFASTYNINWCQLFGQRRRGRFPWERPSSWSPRATPSAPVPRDLENTF